MFKSTQLRVRHAAPKEAEDLKATASMPLTSMRSRVGEFCVVRVYLLYFCEYVLLRSGFVFVDLWVCGFVGLCSCCVCV